MSKCYLPMTFLLFSWFGRYLWEIWQKYNTFWLRPVLKRVNLDFCKKLSENLKIQFFTKIQIYRPKAKKGYRFENFGDMITTENAIFGQFSNFTKWYFLIQKKRVLRPKICWERKIPPGPTPHPTPIFFRVGDIQLSNSYQVKCGITIVNFIKM